MTSESLVFLARPSVVYQDSYLAALREFHVEGRNLYWDYDEVADQFPHFVRRLLNLRDYPPFGKVPESMFWLIDGAEFIGRLSLRHTLNSNLLQLGGHIGYEIRPSCRQRGYGRHILHLGLQEANAIGLRRVLVTCDETNIASARIIEANGGVLENTILLIGRDVPTRRYWIDIASR